MVWSRNPAFENPAIAAADASLLKKWDKNPTVDKTENISKSCFKQFFITVVSKIRHFFKTVFCFNEDLSDATPLQEVTKKVRFVSKPQIIKTKEKPLSPQSQDKMVDVKPQTVPEEQPVLRSDNQKKIADRLQMKLKAVREEKEALESAKSRSSEPQIKTRATPPKKLTAEEVKERRAKSALAAQRALEAGKERARGRCFDFLKGFCNDLDLSTPNAKVQGLPQIGNNCYMNSGIQMLSIYAESQPGFLELLQVQLIPKEGQSLQQFEKEVLSKWAPLEMETYDTQERYCDRILFKWSFLVLCQAKMFGNENAIGAALRSHHSLCFDLGLLSDFFAGRHSQKDVGDYIVLWHQTLQWRPLKKRDQNYCTHQGVLVQNPVVKTRESFLQVPMSSEPLSDETLVRIEKRQNRIRAQYTKLIDRKENEIKSLARNSNKNKNKLKKCNKERLELLRNLQEQLDNCEEKIRSQMHFQCDRLMNDFFSNEGKMRKVRFTLSDGQEIIPKHSLRNTKLGMPLPSTFLIQFGRFYQNELGRGKIKNPIDFDGLELDISAFVNNRDLSEEVSYQITGFVVHIGSMNSGHYVAYVKKHDTDTWYKCNDGTVSTVKDSQLKDALKDAYFCCYERV